MKQVVMFFIVANMISMNECKAQAQQKIAMNAVMGSLYTGKENVDIVSDDINRINDKALNHFSKNFKKASNVKWMVLSDGFLATFHDSHCTQRIFYHEDGSMAGSIKGYQANFLSSEIQQITKEKFPAYSIVYVNEASLANLEGSHTFILQLQARNDFKVVRICDDIVDEIKLQ